MTALCAVAAHQPPIHVFRKIACREGSLVQTDRRGAILQRFQPVADECHATQEASAQALARGQVPRLFFFPGKKIPALAIEQRRSRRASARDFGRTIKSCEEMLDRQRIYPATRKI